MRSLIAALVAVVYACASAPPKALPPIGSAEFDAAIVASVPKDRPQPRCEYSNVNGKRIWEHVNVVENDGTYYTIEYPNRERETSGSRKGLMQQKRVPIEWHTVAPCSENIFTPTAPPEGGLNPPK